MTERPDFDALAQEINLKDITSCERNANILRMLRDGDTNWSKQLYIMNEDDEDEILDGDFVFAEGDDLGWLGYFIGKSEVIKYLHINYIGGDNYFFDGMSQNRSIKELEISYSDIGDDSWITLCRSFLGNNHNLSRLEFQGIVIGHEGAQNLASALGRMNHNSLKHLSMEGNEIGDEGLAEIATTLRLQPQLSNLELSDNNIGRSGCIALSHTLSRWQSSNSLEVLDLSYNLIDGGGLQDLLSGLMNCRSLKRLNLSHNQSITADGLRFLFPLLQSESHSLKHLGLIGIAFGDEGAVKLAEGLRGNKFLKELIFDFEIAGMTSVGWSAFSGLLCDSSTINNTYLSHHTLTNVGCWNNEGTPEDVQHLLTTNASPNAAIYKILKSHPDLDMEHFFEWKMKFLPVAISWLQRARSRPGGGNPWGRESNKTCQSRKLSALYKFVRAMPDLTTIGYWEGRMIHIDAKKRRLADEMRKLEYEEDITRERLGMSGQPMDEASASRNKRMRLE